MADQSTLPIFGNRYVLGRLLGQGGMGAVYEAQDRLTGQTVALKRVLAASQRTPLDTIAESIDVRLALAQEFQLLASVRHPYIIHVLDYGFDDEYLPYFTMDLLVDAQTIQGAGRDRPLNERVNLLIQLVQALAYLHRRGIIHHDLKPANVLVKDGQVKVLDFGLAAVAGQGSEFSGGTLAYLAPELFDGQPASIASDLYAVGLIAYELITDSYPFNLDSATRLMDEIVNKRPDLSLFGAEKPLAYVVDQLLAKSPAERYPDAASVIAAFCEAIGQPIPVEEHAIRESYLQAAPLTGRETELETLSAALRVALDGQGSTWLVAGESGVGKSRLMNELATLALIQGMLVLRGRAVQEGTRLFQVWHEPLRRLALAAPPNDSDAAVLKSVIPDLDTLLERPIPDAQPLDAPAQRARLQRTIRALLHSQSQPIALFLDDLQWIDEESLLALGQLNSTGRPLLVVASYRDDERADLPQLLPGAHLLKLARLSTPQIAELSLAMLGERGSQPEIVAYLQRETEGNVFFLVEVVRVLAEEVGQLADVGKSDLPDHVFAGGIARVIERRLARVDPGSWPLLRAAAVLGRQIDLNVLARIDQSANPQNWLTECANAAVLDVLDGQWQFAHDKLREGVLGGLDASSRAALHGQVATAIERAYPDAPDQTAALAFHWGMAGITPKEARYVRLAGQQAQAVSANKEAIQYFRRALELATDPLDQAHLMIRIGESLFWLGEFNEARQYNLNALEIARTERDPRLISEALSKLGNTDIQQGFYPSAAIYLTEGLEVARQTQSSELISNALSGLGDVSWRMGDYPKAMGYLQDNLRVVRGLNKPSYLGNALNMLGIVYGMQGDLAHSKEAFREALATFRQIGDRGRMAQALSNLGEVLLMEEDYREATPYLEEALALSHEVNNRYSRGNTQLSLGLAALALGTPVAANDYFLNALQNAFQIDSALLMLGALGGFARLAAYQGQEEHALELIGLIAHHPSSSPDLQNMATKDILDQLKARLAPDRYTAALERGKRLDLKATADTILNEND